MRVGFQMDPIAGVDINADSSFCLAVEAQERGHEIFVYGPEALTFDEGTLYAKGEWVRLLSVQGEHVEVLRSERVDLSTLQVIWLRQDPPFDMGYITTTHLLDMLPKSTLVVNDPTWVRNWPEKLMVLDFPDLTPPTMIARDLDELKAFRARHGDVILKPLYGNGGAGVFLLREGDSNLNSLHELFSGINREPLIMQKFLPIVSEGDKRVILVDGEPIGAINRVPAKGETRSNMHVGGKPEPVELTARDREICAAIGPRLKEHGQIFVGIDVIGDYLTEINVTSPTGLQELERFDGVNGAGLIWDAIEAKL